MPRFGGTSKKRLNTCDEDLVDLFNEVIKYFDCTVLEGHRGKDLQNKYYDEGKSKVKFPYGKHNESPSHAVDVVPYPVDWNDTDRMYYFALGFVVSTLVSIVIITANPTPETEIVCGGCGSMQWHSVVAEGGE